MRREPLFGSLFSLFAERYSPNNVAHISTASKVSSSLLFTSNPVSSMSEEYAIKISLISFTVQYLLSLLKSRLLLVHVHLSYNLLLFYQCYFKFLSNNYCFLILILTVRTADANCAHCTIKFPQDGG